MIEITYDALRDLVQLFREWRTDARRANYSRQRFKALLLQKARENVSGAPLNGGRSINRRSGRLYGGLRVVDAPGGGMVLESTARRNGVNYGEVLNAGATIYPKKAKALVFRVPSSAGHHVGFGGSEEKLIFAKKVTIPAFGWKDKALQDTIAELSGDPEFDLNSVLGGR